VEPVDPAARWGDMRARFLADENLTAIPVLNPAGGVLRVLMRSQILAIASGRFGFSLLDGRTISELLDLPACNQPPLTCASDDDLIPVAERILHSGSPWYETAIAVFDGRRYCGILTYPALVAAMLETSRQHAVEMSTARDQALEGMRAKCALLSNVSHELRTPLTAILGFAEMLAEDGDRDSRQAHAGQVQSSGQHLISLLDDLLDGAQLEAQALVLHPCPFAPRAALEEVAAMLAPQVHAKHLAMAVEVDPAVPERIIGDPRRFRQVITNLAGNAVKFTRHGRIDIRLGRSAFAQPNRIELVGHVTDTGPGIAPDVLRRLFTPFVQGDESLSRAHGGFGLGLAITRHLLELMGGSITCESQPNRGSCFRFSFHCAHETQVATTTPRIGAPFV